MNLAESNKLIAEFMGYEHNPHEELTDDFDDTITYNCDNFLVNITDVPDWDTTENDWTSWLRPSEMLFNKSWDWLMPVALKIAKELSIDCIAKRYTIGEVYNDVVEAIKWYNETVKSK